MKTRLIQWLRQLATWLEGPAPAAIIAEYDALLRVRVLALVARADAFAEGTSGEYKRHAVYAQLLKEFPDRDGRDLSLAIELALQERR